jgi:hypothetical protein
MSKILFCLLIALVTSFEIIETVNHPPETHYGDPSVACNPGSGGVTGGFGTSYSDNRYYCSRWDGKAQNLPDCFVAINGICGMDSKFCDKCISVINSNGQVEKCRVIDFCDPKDCDYYDAGHLDFLNNNGNANYKFVDKGVYVYPYSKDDGQPKITWRWTTC